MSKAIYQKYRPKTFKQLYGLPIVKKILMQAIKTEKLSHAYLFAGPRGTGKTTIARLIAKAVNCLDPQNGDACGKCKVCKQIESGHFIDLIEIDAASNRGIDEIRDLRDKINFIPSVGKKKVYIIDEVHMLTKEAFNALLKTLEEPPEFVVFILATTEPHKIPATILSRVQRFNLRLATFEEISMKLNIILKTENIEFSDDAIYRLYELGGGSFRDTESLLNKILNSVKDSQKKISLKDVENIIGLISTSKVEAFVEELVAGNSQNAIKILDELQLSGFNLVQLIDQSLELLRQRLRAVYIRNVEDDKSRLLKVIRELSEVSFKLKTATIVSLPIEIAIYNLDLGIKKSDDNNVTNEKRNLKDTNKKKEEKEKMSKSLNLKNKSQNNEKVKLSLDEISRKWHDVINLSKEVNHHLSAFLSTSKIKSYEDGKLILQVAYKFHKQRIEDPKSQEYLSKVLDNVYNMHFPIKCKVKPKKVSKKNKISKKNNDSKSDIVEEIFSDL